MNLFQLHKLWFQWCLFALILNAGGCSIIRQDMGQSLREDVASLVQARTYHDVLRLMGPPHQLATNDHGLVFLYEETDLTERQLGINLSHDDLTLFKAVIAREVADRNVTMVSFNDSGEIRSYASRSWSDLAAEGGALQFVLVLTNVADEGDLSAPSPLHEWGMSLLEPDLAIQLNRSSDTNSGHAGVRQRGTPAHVGQQALEWH